MIPKHNEGKMVENLRKNSKFIPKHSFVAEVDRKIIGILNIIRDSSLNWQLHGESQILSAHLLKHLWCWN
ncbi:hypothetical protein [Methanosarcina sp. UBA289]|uniref:hypothetical protein n=1 Tax=Methanosarcina sp. UBA289 TaxID=1915574 RepID=UPI0025D45B94|nr:hypothetical protein [Methanosarcina sp. UBA289]